MLDIVRIVRDAGIPVQVGFQSRFHPLIRRLRSMVESAEAGAPMAYTLRDDQFWPTGGVVAGHSSWRSDRAEAGGGALLEHSIHSCDILGWLFGPVERVYATTRSMFGYSVEDVAALTIEHRNGVVGNLVTVFNGVQHREERRLEVFFERASVELTTDFLVGAPEDSFLVHRADEQHAQRYDVNELRRETFAADGFDPDRRGVRVPVLLTPHVRDGAARRTAAEPRRGRCAAGALAGGGGVPQRRRAPGRRSRRARNQGREATIPAFVRAAVDDVPDKPWLHSETGVLTFAQAYARVERAASALRARGVGVGDRVVITPRNTRRLPAELVRADGGRRDPGADQPEELASRRSRASCSRCDPALIVTDAGLAPTVDAGDRRRRVERAGRRSSPTLFEAAPDGARPGRTSTSPTSR